MFKKRADNDIAIVTCDGSYTVGKIVRWADEAAKLIRDQLNTITDRSFDGKKPCLLLPSADPVDYFIGFMACIKAGVTVVPWREDSLAIDIVCDPIRPDAVLRLSRNAIPELTLESVETPQFEGERVGEVIMLTSGSTGAPKGVALDFDQVVLNNLAAGSTMEVWRCAGWSIEINMALMSATCHLIMAWQFGLPFYHLADCRKEQYAEIFSSGAIGFGGSPLQLIKLYDRLGEANAPHTLVSSGDFLTPQMINQLMALFPQARIHKLYGLTELGGRFCCMPHDQLMENKEAAGFPLAGFSARQKDDTALGEASEIEGKSPCRSHGYYLAGGMFSPFQDLWFSTGDIGTISSDGTVTISGRADDVFKVGGEKVDRQTIESALAQILEQHEYVVLAVEHRLLGQCAALFIGKNPSINAPKWAEITRHLKGSLSSRFIPALMYELPEGLPRLANGKIDRRTLKTSHLTYCRLV